MAPGDSGAVDAPSDHTLKDGHPPCPPTDAGLDGRSPDAATEPDSSADSAEPDSSADAAEPDSSADAAGLDSAEPDSAEPDSAMDASELDSEPDGAVLELDADVLVSWSDASEVGMDVEDGAGGLRAGEPCDADAGSDLTLHDSEGHPLYCGLGILRYRPCLGLDHAFETRVVNNQFEFHTCDYNAAQFCEGGYDEPAVCQPCRSGFVRCGPGPLAGYLICTGGQWTLAGSACTLQQQQTGCARCSMGSAPYLAPGSTPQCVMIC